MTCFQLLIAAAQLFRLLAALLYHFIALLSLLLQLLYLHAQALEVAHLLIGFLALFRSASAWAIC